MKVLSFDDIVKKTDIDEKEVFIAEWDGTVKVKGITKLEQQLLRKQAIDPATGRINGDKMEVSMLAQCLSEPAITIEQAELLMQKAASAIDKIFAAILEVTGLDETVQKEMVKTFHIGDA